MKIVVKPGACAGHARCQLIAPELMQADDNGYITAATIDVPVDQEALARRVVGACPEQVLSLEGEPEPGAREARKGR